MIERDVVCKKFTRLREAQSEEIYARLSTYGNTPTFNPPRILPWSKLLSGSKLGSNTQKQLLLHIQSPSFVLPIIRVNQYPSLHHEATRHHSPSTRPKLCGELLYAEPHMPRLDRIIGTSITSTQMRNAKALWRNASCVDGKCGERVESRRAQAQKAELSEWGKSPLSVWEGEITPRKKAGSRWEVVH